MAMGKRQERQESLFVSTEGLPKSLGHSVYKKLNQWLAEAGFDLWYVYRPRGHNFLSLPTDAVYAQ